MPRFSTETLRGFLGVNLRKDRLSLADGDVARSVNADLHSMPGVLRLRLGRSAVTSTALVGTLRRLTRRDDTRYQIAGPVLYRDEASILTGLGPLTTLVHARPLGDTQTWTFIGDRTAMQKDNGTAVRAWGLTPPSAALTLTAGASTGLTGAYKARYTYARVVGATVVHESNPSGVPNPVTLANQDLRMPVTASSDAQVTHIRLYRTLAGGSLYLFDQQVANTTATHLSAQADSALGSAVETDNDVPPHLGWIAEFQGHLFGCQEADHPHYLWWSKRFRPEAYPAANFLALGTPNDPLQCAVSLTGFLGVFSRRTKYRVFGNTTSGFNALEALSSRGTPAPQAVWVTALGAVFPARDGLWLTNFLQADTELSQAIQPLFYGETVHDNAPIDWDRAAEMSCAEYKSRLYFSYVTTASERRLAVYSRDTQRWYFYDHPATCLWVDETADQLLAGLTDGLVWVLDDPHATGDGASAIALNVALPERAGASSQQRKLFQWMRVDADVPSGTLYVDLYIDDTLRHTVQVSGRRTNQRQRLPDRLLGTRWTPVLRYAGTARVALHAVQMQALPLTGDQPA